ncbi:2OG-Fe(II) oxygenase [Aspergillus mulundensis]|uniref:Uncharacterized protein n=1 Tax=Aspergillus mulundensis TaxID=1810919 RepID=A0A3D8T4X4_9EURO|nr:hypothetical protein DSM5745_00927 [Aspergillus mulundensis]RDW93605.1 hypothetical protein DSM5745_00927 [Aspergillus mulundensis]
MPARFFSALYHAQQPESTAVPKPEWVKLKHDLLEHLKRIESTGSFFTTGTLDNAPNPGLDISSVGPVGLPLTPDASRSVAQACHTSPFGKGTETIVDESVRKTWELDAEQFSIRNPKWESQIREILKQVIPELGLKANPDEVQAELYKLLVYEEGAFFLSHQDSEKASGMFGTLVVCLPSKHEGGDVVATHKGEARTFDSSATSEFEYSYAAWYSDVKHEVKPVASGYRVVLTYNLIHRPSMEVLKQRDSAATELQKALESWNQQCQQQVRDYEAMDVRHSSLFSKALSDRFPLSLLCGLDYKYSQADLSFARLKGLDQLRVGRFQVLPMNTEAPQAQYPELRVTFMILKKSSRMTHCSTRLSTSVVVKELEIPLSDLKSLFLDSYDLEGTPDSEDYTGYQGNAGAEATHHYRKAAAFIVPSTFYLAFVFYVVKHGRTPISGFLAELERMILDRPDDTILRNETVKLCQSIISSPESRERETRYRPRRDTEDLKSIASLLINLSEWSLFNDCISEHFGCREFPVEFGAPIGKAVFARGMESLQATLDRLFKDPYGSWKEQLPLLFNIISAYISECLAAGQPKSEPFTQWQDRTLDRFFLNPHLTVTLSEKDAPPLLHIALSYPGDTFLKRIVPVLDRWASNTAFLSSFLIGLFEESQKNDAASLDIKPTYRTICSAAMRELRIVASPTLTSSGYASYGSLYSRRADPTFVDPGLIAKLLRPCPVMDIDPTEIVKGVEFSAGRVLADTDKLKASSSFVQFLTPFITFLCGYLNERSRSEAFVAECRKFTVRMLEILLTNYVEPQPLEPTTWARKANFRTCCKDCGELRRFIEDPVQKTGKFPMAEKRRRHLENRLDRTFTCQTRSYGSPYTLEVTKTNEQFQKDLKDWSGRGNVAVRLLQSLEQKCPDVIELVGEDTFKSFLEHENLKPRVAPPAPPPVAGPVAAAPELPRLPRLGYGGVFGDSRGQGHTINPTRTLPPLSSLVSSAGTGLSSAGDSTVPRKRSYIDLTED